MKAFDFTEEQATAIVMMRLYTLSNTDVTALLNEQSDLNKTIEFLTSILDDEKILKTVMKKELRTVREEFATPRRTEIKDEVTEIKIDAKSMISKENTIVVVTNEGYVKRISPKSYAAANGEQTTLKPGDYITGLYNTTTLDTLLLFTNQGHYLYVPVHEITEFKYKDMGKHINNLIPMAPEEKVIDSLILDSKNTNIILATKQGITKRLRLEDLIVSRYSKPINAIKLKDGDELVSVVKDNGRAIFISQNGYYINIDSNEIPIVGAKASGVKGINLKDDELVSLVSPVEGQDYLTVFTNKNTTKRIKLSDLDKMSRGKKGSTLIKKVKSNTYLVFKVEPTSIRDIVNVKIDGEFKELKVTDIPIMDLASTGSTVSKKAIEDYLIVKELVEVKIDENEEIIKPEPTVTVDENVADGQVTIDDFVEEFKI